jgi:hypothetical protein
MQLLKNDTPLGCFRNYARQARTDACLCAPTNQAAHPLRLSAPGTDHPRAQRSHGRFVRQPVEITLGLRPWPRETGGRNRQRTADCAPPTTSVSQACGSTSLSLAPIHQRDGSLLKAAPASRLSANWHPPKLQERELEAILVPAHTRPTGGHRLQELCSR